MKKYIFLFTLIFFCFSCLSGHKRKESKDKPILTVSIEPQRFLLEQIVGDLFMVKTMLPPGIGPETYEPLPSVMVDLGKSSIYFVVGNLGFEKRWTDKLSQNNPELKIINCSQQIQLITDMDESHIHTSHNCHSNGDPHVWSSPKEMLTIARTMYETMKKYDAENENIYFTNYKRLVSLIEDTDSIIKDNIEKASSRCFVIYHPTLGYFARDYGLRQLSIETEGKNPSSLQMKHLLDEAKRQNARTVFVQKAFDTKNGKTVAKELGATLYTIDPLAYNWDKELIRISSILAHEQDE